MKTKTLTCILLTLLLSPFIRAQTSNLRYEGSWTNTTFGSFGAAHVGAVLDAPNATIRFDLDGFVFGASDPAVIVVPGTICGKTSARQPTPSQHKFPRRSPNSSLSGFPASRSARPNVFDLRSCEVYDCDGGGNKPFTSRKML